MPITMKCQNAHVILVIVTLTSSCKQLEIHLKTLFLSVTISEEKSLQWCGFSLPISYDFSIFTIVVISFMVTFRIPSALRVSNVMCSKNRWYLPKILCYLINMLQMVLHQIGPDEVIIYIIVLMSRFAKSLC